MPYVRISTQQARNAAEKRQFSLGDDDEWNKFKRSLMSTEEKLNEIKFKED